MGEHARQQASEPGSRPGSDRALDVGRLVSDVTPADDAATALLLRESPTADEPEVLLLERHVRSEFAGGAYVFPGGRVDPADGALPADRWAGIDPDALVDTLGVADAAGALALHVCAVRETFEEAGVLLASRHGAPVTAAELAGPEAREARRRLGDHDEDFDFGAWLAGQDLVLDLGALAFWAWWTTPEGLHRRYDTRFFAALLPPEQADASDHDRLETVASRWTTPSAVLAAAAAGEVTVVYPTRKNLEALAGYPTAAAAWEAAAAGRTDRRRIQPRIVTGPDGAPRVQHPDGGEPEAS